MIEGLLMLSMLVFVLLLLIHAIRLTEPRRKGGKPPLALFDFRIGPKPAAPVKARASGRRG